MQTSKSIHSFRSWLSNIFNWQRRSIWGKNGLLSSSQYVFMNFSNTNLRNFYHFFLLLYPVRDIKKRNHQTKTRSRGSKNFIWQKIDEDQKNSLGKNLQLWFLSILCHMKFFDPRDLFLALELSFLKTLSQLAFKALYKTS